MEKYYIIQNAVSGLYLQETEYTDKWTSDISDAVLFSKDGYKQWLKDNASVGLVIIIITVYC